MIFYYQHHPKPQRPYACFLFLLHHPSSIFQVLGGVNGIPWGEGLCWYHKIGSSEIKDLSGFIKLGIPEARNGVYLSLRLGGLSAWQLVTFWAKSRAGWPCHDSHPWAGLKLFEVSLYNDGGDCPRALAKQWDPATSQEEGPRVMVRGQVPGHSPVKSAVCMPLGPFPASCTPRSRCFGSRCWCGRSSKELQEDYKWVCCAPC